MSRATKLPSHYLGADVGTLEDNVSDVYTAAIALDARLAATGCTGCGDLGSALGHDTLAFKSYALSDPNFSSKVSLNMSGAAAYAFGPGTNDALSLVLGSSRTYKGGPCTDSNGNCGGGGGGTIVVNPPGPVTPPTPSNTNVTVTSGTPNTVAWIIGGAIVLAAGIAGWAWYAKGGGKQMLVRKGARRRLRRIKRSRGR